MAGAREVVGSYSRAFDEAVRAGELAGPVHLEEFRRRLKAGEVVALDVRPQVEFASGHIPGAVSIPFDELEARLDELPRDREVIAYCRGPYCLMAREAVRLMEAHGIRAQALEEGILEWRAGGQPVESS
jgi:rhodanese-related sulfurtransferase